MNLMIAVEQRRKQNGQTVTWLAERLGIERTFYYKLLNGEVRPSDRVKARILELHPDLEPQIIQTIREAVA